MDRIEERKLQLQEPAVQPPSLGAADADWDAVEYRRVKLTGRFQATPSFPPPWKYHPPTLERTGML